MAGRTFRRCSGISVRVALIAIHRKVRTRERETGGIVVKSHVCISGRVTGQTGRVFINIAIYRRVAVVCFRIYMAISTGKFCIIGWILVTIRAF